MRWQRRGAAGAAQSGHAAVVWMLAAIIIVCGSGCAMFGRRSPAPEKVAACRELSRQGAAAMESGDWQRAESLLEEALAASPDDVEAHRYLAEALWHRGATEEALSQMATASRLRPTDARLPVRAGEMLLARGARAAALAHAEQAIGLDPQLATAWALRGRVFWQLNQPDRALADLGRALEFAPRSSDVLWDMAVLYRERGQAARCLTTLHQLHDTYRSGEEPQMSLLLEGQTLLDLNRSHQAAESFLAAAQRGPPSAEILYSLAHAQFAAGRFGEATAAAEQALAIDGSHHASRQLLAQLAAEAAPGEAQRR